MSKRKQISTQLGALSLSQFCVRYQISRSHLYTIIKLNQGPGIMHVGGRRLISIASAEKWAKRMEQVSPVNSFAIKPANENSEPEGV